MKQENRGAALSARSKHRQCRTKHGAPSSLARGLVQEILEERREGAPFYEVKVARGRHVRFIELHSPYHVRRLPNDGLLLATHPFRTLWTDAFSVLGIML